MLHHIGPLAGAALIAGAGGTALFGALGPMFSLSTFVICPMISGDGADTPRDQLTPTSTDYSEHHES